MGVLSLHRLICATIRSLARRDLCLRSSRVAERYGNSSTTCSNTGLVGDLSAGTASLFMSQLLNPPAPGVQMGSNDIEGEPKGNTGDEGHKKQTLSQMHRDA